MATRIRTLPSIQKWSQVFATMFTTVIDPLDRLMNRNVQCRGIAESGEFVQRHQDRPDARSLMLKGLPVARKSTGTSRDTDTSKSHSHPAS